MSDRIVIAMSLVSIVMSVASIFLSIAARRRYHRAAWLASMEMDPDYEPPSASVGRGVT